MAIINNEHHIKEIELELKKVKLYWDDPMVREPFIRDFSLRFCWSSNAIEGNTLDLEETVSLIEYDEVRSGHTYSEYQEAKNMYKAIEQMLIPFKKRMVTEEWLKNANGFIRGINSEYRTEQVYIGTLVEAVYYPPDHASVPALMEQFLKEVQCGGGTVKEILERVAMQHIQFERIHPFQDGNGRVGRMMLNQQLINQGMLPLAIEPKGKYRQAFRQYEKNGDISLMTYVLCKGELESIQKMQQLIQKYTQQMKKDTTNEIRTR